MRKFLSFSLGLFFVISYAQKIRVSYNKNIETYFLAEILSAEHREINKDFELSKIRQCSQYEPIVADALLRFSSLKDSDISRKTAAINDKLIKEYGLGNDVLMPALLYHEEFPSEKWKAEYRFNNNQFSEIQNRNITEIITNYIDGLSKFYRQQKIDVFFKRNRNFYNSAEDEFLKQIPQGFVKAMEEYYGEKFHTYNVLLSPMMMWPIEDNEGRGIGSKTEINGKTDIYEIASPFVRVTKSGQFGYDNQFEARFLTVHEFGHSFVNKEVYSNQKLLINFQKTFEQSNLKEIMIKTGGYGDYQTCVAEHLVRLGEIEVALLQKDQQRADKLLAYHLKNHFIFLPDLLKKIETYNKNRDRYKFFGEFVPVLMEVFESQPAEMINKKLKDNI